jgi:uncharacterized membrane protein YraQ (UPF0718 family)
MSNEAAAGRRSSDEDLPTTVRVAAVGALVLAVLLVAGLAWAKWLPYADKVHTMSGTRAWDGTSALEAGGTAPSLAAAWAFATAYTAAVWKALVVSLLVAAGLDALVSRRWLVRVLSRRGPWRQAAAGGLASLPTMMCTCCTAPIAITMRRAGVPLPAAVAYWLGNPLLNPAVLVFLFLVAPWQWGVTRLLVGAALAIGASAVVGGLGDRRSGQAPDGLLPDEEEEPPRLAQLPGRFLRSLLRLGLVLVPEYAVVVLLVGAFSGWLSQFADLPDHVGLLAVLVAAVVGTLLVVPTGGEIPVLVGLSALGAGSGMLGVLLVTLPALSLPSMVMVARALSVRVTALLAGAVAVGGLAAGLLLTVLA